jgi:hypothetical protein
LIPLTVAETRRLFHLADQGEHAIDHGLHWSAWRRAHQAEARRHHIKLRLKLQVLAL